MPESAVVAPEIPAARDRRRAGRTRHFRRTRRTPVPATLAVLAAVGAVLPAPLAAAADDFLVFLRDGRVRQLTVTSFDTRSIQYEDLGQPGILTVAEVLAIVQGRDGELARIARAPILRRTRGMLELRTGERIPGLVGGEPGSSPDRLRWIASPLGDREVALEDVARIVPIVERDPGPVELAEGDRVVLTNGDRLDGFVDSVGTRVTVFRETSDGEEPIEVPIERVAAIRLVTGSAPPGDRRVWLGDGTVIDVETMRAAPTGELFIDGERVGADLLPLSLDDVAAVLFDTRGLQPLASAELERVARLDDAAAGLRYRVQPPRPLDPDAAAGLGSLELTGPMTATWVMPEGARRFAATAVLPAVARTWGDLELVVLDGREERLRTRIDGLHPVAEIDVPLSAAERRLTLRLEPGRYGPVMDRLELRLPRVLVD